MKRKYPAVYFFLGLIQNMIRYFWILLIALVLIIIGAINKNICLYIGLGVLAIYILVCFIEQMVIRSTALKQTGNPAYDEIMDVILGGSSEDVNNAINKHAVRVEPESEDVES